MDDLDKAVERLEALAKFSSKSGAFGRAVRKSYEQPLRDDLRTILSALHQRGEALSNIEALTDTKDNKKTLMSPAEFAVATANIIARQALSNTTEKRVAE